jgi:hypothetical protein
VGTPLIGLYRSQEPYAKSKVDNYVHRNSICHVEPSDAVPLQNASNASCIGFQACCIQFSIDV